MSGDKRLVIKSAHQALEVAYEMLRSVEKGKTYSALEWCDRMDEIYKWLRTTEQHERLHEMHQRRGK